MLANDAEGSGHLVLIGYVHLHCDALAPDGFNGFGDLCRLVLLPSISDGEVASRGRKGCRAGSANSA